ncbi:MAG: CerR family C-terminal domain-containing protein [Desulfamplus sp.]|nr:CerR family C-terminal domain-containing protein [Desulfamplus sp.]
MTTRDRIIQVAGDIFGMEGFKAATIRKIAEAANANVASINYYFRDKEGLYAEVLEELFAYGFKKFPANMGLNLHSSPEERLKAFIRGMFFRLMSSDGWGGISGKARLLARELMEPTPAFESTIEKYIKPHKDILVSILADLTGPDVEIDKLLLCSISIIGQCIYYAFATPVIQKIAPEFTPVEENLERLADHVYTFSIGGIKAIKEFS